MIPGSVLTAREQKAGIAIRELAWALLFGVVYFLAAEAGHRLSFEPGHVATFWPPSGIFLVVLLAVPVNRHALYIASGAVANVLSDVVAHEKLWSLSLAMTFANTLEAIVGSWMIRRGVTGRFSLERLPDVSRLLSAAFLVPLLSAAVAAIAVRLNYDTSFLLIYFVWWIADCVGILIVAPLAWAALYWRQSSIGAPTDWWRTAELAASFITLSACTFLVFLGKWPALGFPFLLIPLLHWPALRFGTVAVAGSIGVMSVIITLATQAGEGPFAHQFTAPAHQAVIVQAFLASVSVPFLALAAMWHEREVAAEEMERRIEQRTRQLAEADQRKDHFLAVLAHELRNPLSPLRYALDVWPSVAANPERSEEIRQIMSNQVNHMTGLIDDLLDVSRIAGGKILLKKECIDLRDVVRTAIQSMQNLANEAGHCITTHVPSVAVMVEGDRARLVQVVGNLLHNAIKYTGQGGQIELAVETHDQVASIRVTDNGPGIPKPDLERIFELFTQVDQTLERSHGGLGIGLTLVKNLVELHGGSAQAFSDGLGHGSSFVITLPCIARGPNPLMSASQSPDRKQLPMRRILVVDDTQASARMLGLLLKSLGQQVETCVDGPSALKTVLEFKPSLIFLDIAMPGMSGYEVATQLKSQPETRDIVLVAMTGFGQASDRQRAFESGFDHHMVKPANIEALTQVIAGEAANSGEPRA